MRLLFLLLIIPINILFSQFKLPVNDSVQNFLFAKSSSNDPVLITVNGIFQYKSDWIYLPFNDNSFKKEISTLRTGRANINMLDTIKVDVYGQLMPIEQLGTVSVPEARLISIQVWDKNNVKLVDSEIQKSNLGVTPQVDGQIVRIHIPQLTEERRKELTKVLKNLGEKAKISVRNIRRECNDNIKNLLKEKKISEDESKSFEEDVQKSTDDSISLIEKILSEKEKEILTL
mgnify:CR=1 FL=1